MSPNKTEPLCRQLRQQGLKLTPQRVSILQVFQSLPEGSHLSVEELHQLLVRRGQPSTISTLYRNLHLMANLGILRELDLASLHKHYELSKQTTHHHLVCVQCNRTIEFANPTVAALATRQAELAGLHMHECQLTIKVICPEALRRGWPGSISSDWSCQNIR